MKSLYVISSTISLPHELSQSKQMIKTTLEHLRSRTHNLVTSIAPIGYFKGAHETCQSCLEEYYWIDLGDDFGPSFPRIVAIANNRVASAMTKGHAEP